MFSTLKKTHNHIFFFKLGKTDLLLGVAAALL